MGHQQTEQDPGKGSRHHVLAAATSITLMSHSVTTVQTQIDVTEDKGPLRGR